MYTVVSSTGKSGSVRLPWLNAGGEPVVAHLCYLVVPRRHARTMHTLLALLNPRRFRGSVAYDDGRWQSIAGMAERCAANDQALPKRDGATRVMAKLWELPSSLRRKGPSSPKCFSRK